MIAANTRPLAILQCIESSGFYNYALADETTLNLQGKTYDSTTGLNTGAASSPVFCASSLSSLSDCLYPLREVVLWRGWDGQRQPF